MPGIREYGLLNLLGFRFRHVGNFESLRLTLFISRNSAHFVVQARELIFHLRIVKPPALARKSGGACQGVDQAVDQHQAHTFCFKRAKVHSGG